MNTRLLKYAVEVERAGSITKAAEDLYMSQPNLSKALRELESEFGVTIFNRTTKGIEPTVKGVEFLKHAKRVLEQLNEMETLFVPEKSGIVELDAAVPRARDISYKFANYINSLDTEKGIRATYVETDTRSIIDRISNFTSGVGVMRCHEAQEQCWIRELETNDIKYRLLGRTDYIILMSEKHPLANYEKIKTSDLEGFIEISDGDYDMGRTSDGGTVLPVKRITVLERGSQLDLLRQAPATYMKEAPVPEAVLENSGLVQKRLEDSREIFADYFIFRNGYRLTKDEEGFYEALKTAAE